MSRLFGCCAIAGVIYAVSQMFAVYFGLICKLLVR